MRRIVRIIFCVATGFAFVCIISKWQDLQTPQQADVALEVDVLAAKLETKVDVASEALPTTAATTTTALPPPSPSDGGGSSSEASPSPNAATTAAIKTWVNAPAEGGAFSEFFNQRRTGRGIHKHMQYFAAYNRHFARFIGKEVHIVEIGIQSGGSLEMWKSVFGPRAHVYGVDIDPATKLYEDNQTRVFIGDQGRASFWEHFRSQVPHVDILIDDGGHTAPQMIVTLGEMLPHLAPDGVLMIEDIQRVTHPFWKSLRLFKGSKQYSAMTKLVGSLHVYPYLFVVQKGSSLAVMQHIGGLKVRSAHLLSQHSQTMSFEQLRERFIAPAPNLQISQSTEVHDMNSGISQLHHLAIRRSNSEQLLLFTYRCGQDNDLRLEGCSSTQSWVVDDGRVLWPVFEAFVGLHDLPGTKEHRFVESVHVYPGIIMVTPNLQGIYHMGSIRHGTIWHPYEKSRLSKLVVGGIA